MQLQISLSCVLFSFFLSSYLQFNELGLFVYKKNEFKLKLWFVFIFLPVTWFIWYPFCYETDFVRNKIFLNYLFKKLILHLVKLNNINISCVCYKYLKVGSFSLLFIICKMSHANKYQKVVYTEWLFFPLVKDNKKKN